MQKSLLCITSGTLIALWTIALSLPAAADPPSAERILVNDKNKDEVPEYVGPQTNLVILTESTYTELKLDDCMAIEPSATEKPKTDYGHWQCDGMTEEWPVHVFGDDLRYAVSYGENGPQERAAQQWFGPFNRIHTTLEWVKAGDSIRTLKPVATILRFFLQVEGDDGKPREHPILVITQLKPGAVCHIAYVDAGKNKHANRDARMAAVRLGGSYNCDVEPEIVGPTTPILFGE